jgi:hypothetical protein
MGFSQLYFLKFEILLIKTMKNEVCTSFRKVPGRSQVGTAWKFPIFYAREKFQALEEGEFDRRWLCVLRYCSVRAKIHWYSFTHVRKKRIRSKVAVRFAVSQRKSENWERLKMSFERWSDRGSYSSLIRSLKLFTCESRFIKKNKRRSLKSFQCKSRTFRCDPYNKKSQKIYIVGFQDSLVPCLGRKVLVSIVFF